MKKLAVALSLLLTLTTSGQTYVSGSFSYYNGAGTFEQQGMATLEVGKVIQNTATIGIAAGVTSFSGSNTYLEFRPSITLWSYKDLSISGTLGAGYIFNSSENFLTEYCGTMCYSLSKNWSVCLFGGGYNFNGKTSSSKYSFVGAGLTFTIPKYGKIHESSRIPGLVHSQARY